MAEMFASATAYEKMMGRWSMRLAPLFARFAQVQDGNTVLDVGCGTGSLVQAVADMTRRSEIVGIDPVKPFIEYSRTRFAGPRITFDCGSALELPYPDGSFDQSLSLLVLMFIPQPEKAASEMRRVTRPGGTVAACTWDHEGLEMSAVFWKEAIKLDPAAKARAERQRYLQCEGQLAELWHETGSGGIEETVLEFRMDFTSFDDYWAPLLNGVGPSGSYVADLSPDARDALRQRLRTRLLADRPDGPYSLRAKAWAVRGTVPKSQ